MVPVFTPRARIICGLSPVARMDVPRFVRKNAYSTPPASTMKIRHDKRTEASRVDTSHPSQFIVVFPPASAVLARSAQVASVVSDSSGMLLRPMTCRFTEYSAVITRMPESRL